MKSIIIFSLCYICSTLACISQANIINYVFFSDSIDSLVGNTIQSNYSLLKNKQYIVGIILTDTLRNSKDTTYQPNICGVILIKHKKDSLIVVPFPNKKNTIKIIKDTSIFKIKDFKKIWYSDNEYPTFPCNSAFVDLDKNCDFPSLVLFKNKHFIGYIVGIKENWDIDIDTKNRRLKFLREVKKIIEDVQ